METHETPDGRICCSDCGRWIHKGSDKQIVHSSRCDSKDQPAASASTEPVIRYAGAYSTDSPASGLTQEEIASELYLGYLTESDAMNTDF